LTFKEKREIINEFYEKNFDVLKGSKCRVAWIERENEKRRQLSEERRFEFVEYKWKLFRCTNGKVKIIRDLEKDDHEKLLKERKLIAYWAERNGLTLEKKILPRKEMRALQEKVDKLNIIKGFPKVVWDYCTFPYDEYNRRKEKLKIERDYYEIYSQTIYARRW
jgi:hypothetical protein